MSRVMSAPPKQPQTVTKQPQVATPVRAAAPTHEQIAKRAYEKWIKRGRSHGNHQQDWTEAEMELRREMTAGTTRR